MTLITTVSCFLRRLLEWLGRDLTSLNKKLHRPIFHMTSISLLLLSLEIFTCTSHWSISNLAKENMFGCTYSTAFSIQQFPTLSLRTCSLGALIFEQKCNFTTNEEARWNLFLPSVHLGVCKSLKFPGKSVAITRTFCTSEQIHDEQNHHGVVNKIYRAEILVNFIWGKRFEV